VDRHRVDSARVTTDRLEAFSDGVIAILITIMVLELRPPHEASFAALKPLVPVLLAYVLSFTMLGIYWNNHHHMFHTTENVNGAMLWANLHLLFWLSLAPFVTAWMGENHFAAAPTAAYGCNMLLCAIAYTILQTVIIRHQGPNSRLKRAVGNDLKGKISGLLYFMAIPLAFVHPGISGAIYVTVALIWLVPDRRIERTLRESSQPPR
jgi:uncharacterized membrane protein